MLQQEPAGSSNGTTAHGKALQRVNSAQHQHSSLLREGRWTFLGGEHLHDTRHVLYVQVQLQLDGAVHGDACHLQRNRKPFISDFLAPADPVQHSKPMTNITLQSWSC